MALDMRFPFHSGILAEFRVHLCAYGTTEFNFAPGNDDQLKP